MCQIIATVAIVLDGASVFQLNLEFLMNYSNRQRSVSVLSILFSLLWCSNLIAQTGPTISYQGQILDSGSPASGSYSIEVLIYNVATGGSPYYTETQTVTVTNGIFNMAIGTVKPLQPSLDFTKQYYLAIAINGGAELSPRSLVSFSPYAFRALNADTSTYATTAGRATLANGVSGGYVENVNGDNGNLTISGANGITVTNNAPNIVIGNSGVQSVNTAGGKLMLVGAGGTTITDTGTTITIHSQTFTGGTGIQAVQNSDSSITVLNGGGPTATISLGKQGATSGQVLAWNGSAWKPASGSGGIDSIKDLQDARDDGSSVYLGSGSGVSNTGTDHNVGLGIGALHANNSGYDNTAVGDTAMNLNTTGYLNVAVGMNALAKNNGYENVAVGAAALQNLNDASSGNFNTAVGYQCMNQMASGAWNTAVGCQAMVSSTGSASNGHENSAFGYLSLQNNSGAGNVALGWESMRLNTYGSQNVAVGDGALIGNRVGNYNIAIGSGSLENLDSGWSDVAVGVGALDVYDLRSNLVAIGDSALYNNGYSFTQNAAATQDSGVANTAVGSKALYTNSTGAYNTAVGFQGQFGNSSGYRNTSLGYLALNQNVTGNDNTAVGDSTGPNTSGLSNTTTLGSGARASASNQVVIGNSGVTSIYCTGAYFATTANSANMVVTANGQFMRSTSSARYKTDIHDLDINTDKLYDLRPVSYTSKIDGKPYFGLVAEDVAKVLPELAEYARSKDVIPGSTSDKLIPDAVKYPMLSVLLLEELKKEHTQAEQEHKQVESQEHQLATQTQIIADLERRVEALEATQKSAR